MPLALALPLCSAVISHGGTTVTTAALAYALCVVVEVSQLYHAPWIDAVRATRLGHLVLGSGFDARDLLAYAVGVAFALLAEQLVVPRSRYRPQDA